MMRMSSLIGRATTNASALVLVGLAACSDRSTVTSPTAVSAAFLDAVAKSKWTNAAALLDLVQLDTLRKKSARAERLRRSAPSMTFEQLMGSNPDMPRSVAAYELKQREQRKRSINYLRAEFGIGDPDSLLRAPLETLATRWVEVHDERWQNRELHRECARDGRDNDLPAPTFRIVGSVVDGSRAYVVYSDTVWQSGMDPVYAPAPRVIQLRFVEQRWKILPRNDLIGLPELVVACG